MKWVTRSHVHVDRVACPWLITRFIDSEAEFLFVPKSEIARTVEATGAIPFDAPGVELGHHAGDGTSPRRCSFESIILKYELKDPGLLRLAQIVHSADVAADIDADPIAPGLEALASGYSLRFPDDRENLARQFEVYDALYTWCRMQAIPNP
jgi:hypothetical protein